MKQNSIRLLLFLLLFFSSPTLLAATGQRAMVATADPRATEAALEILHEGGNAVDAACAAQWVLSVVEPQSSGLGGGAFFLYYEAATKRIYAFDGREAAPAKATPDMFLDENGEPYPFKPDRITGGLAVGVPGTLKLLKVVHERFGSVRFSFASLFEPAIELAEKGMKVSPRLSSFIEQEKGRLKLFKDSRRIFFNKEGEAHLPGHRLVQPELADTFREIQREGIDIFYEGRLAREIAEAVKTAPYHPGRMEASDLAHYEVHEREPVRGSYQGHDIFAVGPPSSGGTTLIEILHILEFYHLGLHGRSADGLHLFAEAQKLAFEDRNQYLADPDFVKIPLDELLSKEFAKKRSEEIRFDAAMPTPQAAVRPLHLEGTHTTHIAIVDPQGNMVAYTSTIEDIFGSGMIVPGRGFFLNNELTDFDAYPWNEKEELVANAVQGGKRPRSSMTPTFVFRNGKPVLTVGSPGGTAIIGTVVNILVNFIDFKMFPQEAVAAPRIVARNGQLEVEGAFFEDAELKRGLLRKGHSVLLNPRIGNAQAIFFDESQHPLIGVSDPRGEGAAEGY